MASPSQLPFAGRLVAWLGGALFVVSLGYGVWFFAVTLATPGPPRPSWPAAAWNVALFTIFAGHHSVMARGAVKAWVERVIPPALERTTYVWIASLLFLGLCLAWQRVPGVLYEARGPAAWCLWAVQATGIVLTLAGARVLDAWELAGIRQVSATAAPLTVRVVWPFTFVRHPIYLGWVLWVGGAAPMTVDRAVWAVVSTIYLILAMPWEERSLAARAGPAYAAYCRQVRWRLVPGVY